MRMFDYSTAFAIICSCSGQSQKFCEDNKSAYLCSKDNPNNPKPICQAEGSPIKSGFRLGTETNKIVKDINEFRKKWVEGKLAIHNPKYRYGRSVMLMKWSIYLQKQAQIQASYCSKVTALPANLETEYPPGFSLFSKNVIGGHSHADELWDDVFKEYTKAELDKLNTDGKPKPDDFVFLGRFHLIGCGIMSVVIDAEQVTLSSTLVCHLVHGPLSNKVPFEEGNSKQKCMAEDCPEHTSCTKQEYENLFCEWDGGGSSMTMNLSVLLAHSLFLWIAK